MIRGQVWITISHVLNNTYTRTCRTCTEKHIFVIRNLLFFFSCWRLSCVCTFCTLVLNRQRCSSCPSAYFAPAFIAYRRFQRTKAYAGHIPRTRTWRPSVYWPCFIPSADTLQARTYRALVQPECQGIARWHLQHSGAYYQLVPILLLRLSHVGTYLVLALSCARAYLEPGLTACRRLPHSRVQRTPALAYASVLGNQRDVVGTSAQKMPVRDAPALGIR